MKVKRRLLTGVLTTAMILGTSIVAHAGLVQVSANVPAYMGQGESPQQTKTGTDTIMEFKGVVITTDMNIAMYNHDNEQRSNRLTYGSLWTSLQETREYSVAAWYPYHLRFNSTSSNMASRSVVFNWSPD